MDNVLCTRVYEWQLSCLLIKWLKIEIVIVPV